MGRQLTTGFLYIMYASENTFGALEEFEVRE